ncbi:hypothetical protein D3C78_1103590 [compost metagenome]
MVVVEVHAERGITKLFAYRCRVQLLALVQRLAATPGFDEFVHAHVVLLGEPVTGEGNLAVILVKALGIAGTVGLAAERIVFRERRPRLGDIE